MEEKQHEKKVDTTEVNMFRWMCGYKLKERRRWYGIVEFNVPLDTV